MTDDLIGLKFWEDGSTVTVTGYSPARGYRVFVKGFHDAGHYDWYSGSYLHSLVKQ